MPAKMISETPLPMPREVICSPSHIKNMTPPVNVTTVDSWNMRPGLMTRPWRCLQTAAIANDCTTARNTVR